MGKQSLSRQFNAFFTFLAGEKKKAAEEEGTPWQLLWNTQELAGDGQASERGLSSVGKRLRLALKGGERHYWGGGGVTERELRENNF